MSAGSSGREDTQIGLQSVGSGVDPRSGGSSVIAGCVNTKKPRLTRRAHRGTPSHPKRELPHRDEDGWMSDTNSNPEICDRTPYAIYLYNLST